MSDKTIYLYSSYLEEVLFAFYLHKFDYSIRKAMLTIPKVYVSDVGVFSNSYPEETGRAMETIMFTELKKKELAGEHEVFYFKTREGYEVDFLVREGVRIKELIQVTYADSFDEIERREYRALLKAYELFKNHKPELTLVTWDYEDKREIAWFGRKGRIRFVPLWKWMLEF